VIYDAQGRATFADALLHNLNTIRAEIPVHYRWLADYTQPQGIPHDEMTAANFQRRGFAWHSGRN
jgi:uncharacterized protein YktB (UPF0637 family)